MNDYEISLAVHNYIKLKDLFFQDEYIETPQKSAKKPHYIQYHNTHLNSNY